MSGYTEKTSNSAKYTPVPISALLANFGPLQGPESADSSYTSLDDSDESFNSKTAIKKRTPKKVKEIPLPQKSHLKEMVSSTPKSVIQSCNINAFASEKKYNRKEYDKENYCNHTPSNRTFPSKDQPDNVSRSLLREQLRSVGQKYNGVTQQVHNLNNTIEPAHKRTPEVVNMPMSNQKTKTVTPIIKPGIRKYTPGSSRLSQKRTPSKMPLSLVNKSESVKCLFPDNSLPQEEHKSLPPPRDPAPVPETPLNRKLMPPPYVATPSYPQGVVGNKSKMTLKTTLLKGKKYVYIKKLGVGGSSEVYKVIEVAESREYAIKCVDLATDKELAQGYINEVRLLRELQNSDRVIRLYDYEYDRANHFLRVVLEVGETDLSSYLKSHGTGGLSSALVLHYWEEMLKAVNYIHEQGVIHADLKPANFLLVCGKLKLIDFGIASAVATDATSVVRAHATGTYSYISPEALMGGAGGHGAALGDAPIKISFRSDVWSLGCILYSMVYGKTPFSHIPNLAKLAAILDPNHKIEYPAAQNLPPSLISALKWCLTYNAKSRPWVSDLLAIPYLQTYHPLPHDLLAKIQPHVTPEQFQLLQSAKI